VAKKTPQPTIPPRERAFLVGVEIRGNKQPLSLEDSLTELSLLADTAGVDEDVYFTEFFHSFGNGRFNFSPFTHIRYQRQAFFMKNPMAEEKEV